MANPTRYSLAFFVLFLMDSSCTAFSSIQIVNIFSRRMEENKVSFDKKNCYNDIDSGLWGDRCRGSMVDRENCALRCLSPTCYDLIYENDPLEEGERGQIREQEYRFCLRRVHGHEDALKVHNMDGYHTISKVRK